MPEVVVCLNDAGLRLDVFVARCWGVSRAFAQEGIELGSVLVNGRVEKKRYVVALSDRIDFSPKKSTISPAVQPRQMDFDILFEDESLFVINKPAGLVVHPAPGNYEGTFVSGFLAHCALSDFDDPIRPGIVHRLDKQTSGVLIGAKNREALHRLSQQFHDRTVYKEYVAIVKGSVTGPQVVEGSIGRDAKHRQRMAVVLGGRASYTEFYPICSNAGYTLIRAVPKTGRTHQIRVHAAFLGHPVLGDLLYSKEPHACGAVRQMLHCSLIRFAHPTTGKTLTLKAPLPVDMLNLMKDLGLHLC